MNAIQPTISGLDVHFVDAPMQRSSVLDVGKSTIMCVVVLLCHNWPLFG